MTIMLQLEVEFRDADPLNPQPIYWAGRFYCRPETPWEKRFGRAFHPRAREVADSGETRQMECPVCGHSWTEELPQ